MSVIPFKALSLFSRVHVNTRTSSIHRTCLRSHSRSRQRIFSGPLQALQRLVPNQRTCLCPGRSLLKVERDFDFTYTPPFPADLLMRSRHSCTKISRKVLTTRTSTSTSDQFQPVRPRHRRENESGIEYTQKRRMAFVSLSYEPHSVQFVYSDIKIYSI